MSKKPLAIPANFPSVVVTSRRKLKVSSLFRYLGATANVVNVSKEQTIFTECDEADAVFYVQKGKVRLTVGSSTGREATIGIVGSGGLVGEDVLGGQIFRTGSAVAITDCQLLRLNKKSMLIALHDEHSLSNLFVAYLLELNARYEEVLVDQLFSSAEKRLARILLLLARCAPEGVLPEIDQTTMAEMIGANRGRVRVFMRRFRKLGFIDYDDGLRIHSSLVNVILHS